MGELRGVLADAWLAAGSAFDFRGHRVFYRREGSGPALVLVHGYPTSSWDWAKIWAPLAARFDVIAPDMLGFGFSAKPRGHRYRIVRIEHLRRERRHPR